MVKGKKQDEAETQREREKRKKSERGGGWRAGASLDLTCLGYRPVEPVNSGVPEVPHCGPDL